jgi:purine-binding chemotaxis protein CheW
MSSLSTGGKANPVLGPEIAPEDLERVEDVLRAELFSLNPGHLVTPPVKDPLDQFFWREDEIAPGVAALHTGVRAPPVLESNELRSEWLTFRLGTEEYGVEIGSIREILKVPSVTEVPRAPSHILGVIMVRGDVIAVIDPRRRLGLATLPPTNRSRILVCESGEGPRGLLVDSVSQVIRLPASAMESRPAGIGGPAGDYLAGIGRDRDRFFILLDLPAVLRDAAGGRQAEVGP